MDLHRPLAPALLRATRARAPRRPLPSGPRDLGPASSLSMAPFHLSAAYDRLRLSICQEQGPRANRMRIASLGSATLLRCDDVESLNVVYAPEERVADRLDLIEDFYRASAHGCRLIAPTRSTGGRLARACDARGWTAGQEFAWLFAACPTLAVIDDESMTVRQARFEERDEFLHLGLRALGDQARDLDAAVTQLRYWFLHPSFRFLFACWRGRPVGVGVLYHLGSSILLGEAALLPAYRGLGGDRALLNARIRLAQSLGGLRLYARAEFSSPDHANMLRAGLRTVRTTASWLIGPDRRAAPRP